MTNNQYHGIAVRKSTASDLWFTFCPSCSEEGMIPCYLLTEDVPSFFLPYTAHQAWNQDSRQSPDDNSVAVSKKATATQKAAAVKIYPKSGTIKRRILSLIT